jgi:hypothetical protein
MKQVATVLLAVGAVVGVIALIELVHLPETSRWWREVQNAGHIPLFGIVALACLGLVRRNGYERATTNIRPYVSAFGLAMTIGLAIELRQYVGDRDADLWDIARNTVGAISFLAWRYAGDPAVRMHWRATWLLRSVAVIVFSAAMLPLPIWWLAYQARDNRFPVVCSFDSSLEQLFYITQDAEFERSPSPRSTDGHGRLTLRRGRYPGLTIEEPYPDWSNYRHLVIKLFNETADTFPLALRIDDLQHNYDYNDRFNKLLRLAPGENRLSVSLDEIRSGPTDRELDLSSVARIWLFAVDLEQPVTILLDTIRLE